MMDTRAGNEDVNEDEDGDGSDGGRASGGCGGVLWEPCQFAGREEPR